MKVRELRGEHIALFARKIVTLQEWGELPGEEQTECEQALAAAKAMASGYAGLDLATSELEDVTYAVECLAAEMLDQHQVSAQTDQLNPTVKQILDMHSSNLLPSQ